MEHDTAEVLPEEGSANSRSGLLTWPALVAIGWLLYEFTAQPNLGAVIICAKFGWDDFRSGLWLRRADTYRARGRACFWFYLASGLWKMAITATIAIFAFAFLAARPAQPRGNGIGMPSWFPGVALTALVGFGLSTLTTCVALELARQHRVKFWLSSTVHRFRRKNLWPPYDVYKFPANHAGLVILSALVLLLLPALLMVCVALGAAFGRFGPLSALVMVMVLTCIGPVMVLVFRDVLNQRFVARTPWECWGTEAPEESVAWQDPL